MSETALQFKAQESLTFEQQGETFLALLSGGLYWPDRDIFFLADLHLEKGSAFAIRGQFIPPYDSLESLKQLSADIESVDPAHVICLGDSFHDVGGPARLPDDCRQMLAALMANRRWTWISGNHDPELDEGIGGEFMDRLIMQGADNSIGLTHEPGSLIAHQDAGLDIADDAPGLELSGHLHPVASLTSRQRGRPLRRKAFVITKNRIILPAYGSYTGGLNVRDQAFEPLLDRDTRLVVLGRQTICLCEAARALSSPARSRRR